MPAYPLGTLRPRAIAILVALRVGPRDDASLQHAIGDSTIAETSEMTGYLGDQLSCRSVGATDAMIAHAKDDERWHLTYEGMDWLQRRGLDASEAAKSALYAAIDADLATQADDISRNP